MKIVQKLLVTCLMHLIFFQPTNAQVAITAVPFLQINNDARSMGLAGATVALNHTRGGLHLNPATFGSENTIQITSPFNVDSDNGFFITPWLPGFNVDNIYLKNPEIIAGFNDFSLGYQFTYINLGEQAQTNESNPEENYRFNSYEYAHTISGSVSLNDDISIGLGLNFIKSSLATGTTVSGEQVYSANQLTIDLGFYTDHTFWYKGLLITPSIGLSLTDFGYPISYTTSSQEDPMPMTMRGGFGLKFETEAEFFTGKIFSVAMYGSLDKVMARRHDDGKPYGPFEALVGSWDKYESYYGSGIYELTVWDQFQQSLGVETIFLEMISFRFGHFYEHPVNGNRVYDTVGLGFHYKYFSFDYARMDVPERGHPLKGTKFYQFSVNIPLYKIQHLINR